MKNLKMLYIALIALVAGTFGACTTDFEAGPQASGPQVSFMPNNVTAIEFTGAAGEETQKLVLSRSNTAEELEVYIFADVKKEDKAIFSIPEFVTFAAGEATAELVMTIDQSKMENDTDYTVGFYIDETLTTPYGYAEWTIKFALNPWELVKAADGSNAKAKFRCNDLLTSLFNINGEVEVEVNMYEHKSIKGYYKFEDPWTPSIAYGFEYPSIEAALADGISTTNADFLVDATNPKQVVFAQQALGIDLGYGDMIVESGYPRYMDAAAGAGTLEEGVITFPTKGCIFAMPGYSSSAYYANTGGLFRIVLPGVDIADYSLAVEYDGMDVAADNKTTTAKFKFTYGDDVTGIKYMIVEGNIEADPTEALNTLFAGTSEAILSVEDFEKGAKVVGVKAGMERGSYTIVAAPADKSGELRAKSAVVKQFYFMGLGETIDTTCQAEAAMVLPSEFNPALVAQYPDQTSLIAVMSGTEIKSVAYYLNTTEIIATWTGTPEELVAEYGSELPAQYLENVNSEDGFATPFTKRASDTEYGLIVVFTNTYGESKTVVATKKTAAYDYSDYTGELVIGQYYLSSVVATQSGERTYENLFTVAPNGDSTTEFLVSDLGLADGNQHKFYANYDAAAGTFTVTGVYAGAESYGNIFGAVTYGTYGQYTYTIFAGESGRETIVFGVDPTTKALSSLQTDFEVGVIQNGSYIGFLAAYTAATATVAPYTASTTSSVKPASVTNVPFSSVKVDKSFAAMKNSFAGIKAAGALESGKNTIKTVKPSVVENYTPVKVKGCKDVKANAEAFRL